MTRLFIHTFTFTFVFCMVSSFPISARVALQRSRAAAEKIVAAVVRADYQGDRAALARLEQQLAAVADDEALALVPDWHYVRDILLPQITKASRGRVTASTQSASLSQPALTPLGPFAGVAGGQIVKK